MSQCTPSTQYDKKRRKRKNSKRKKKEMKSLSGYNGKVEDKLFSPHCNFISLHTTYIMYVHTVYCILFSQVVSVD